MSGAGSGSDVPEIRVHEKLPHVSMSLFYRDRRLDLEKVLLDTGSASTNFSADRYLRCDPTEILIDRLSLGDGEVSEIRKDRGLSPTNRAQ